MTQAYRKCAYCGGVCNVADTDCTSCGSRVFGSSGFSDSSRAERQHRVTFLPLTVWLFLGLFGGYAYWYGNKAKAYARAGLWLTSVGWVTLGVVAKKSGYETWSSSFGLAFFATLLLVVMLWVFDLAHLLSKSKAND